MSSCMRSGIPAKITAFNDLGKVPQNFAEEVDGSDATDPNQACTALIYGGNRNRKTKLL